MGNHRFRLSDMIPNAWFYKLRDMNTTATRTRNSHPRKKHPPPSSSPTSTATTAFYHHYPHLSSPPQSYCHATESTRSFNLCNSPEGATSFSDSPKRKTVYMPSENQISQTGITPTGTSSSDEEEEDDDDSTTLPPELAGLEESINFQPGKSFSRFAGVRLRANSSPRIANKKIQSHARRSSQRNRRSWRPEKMEFAESVAMVKASLDPQKDFRESMMEMIAENDMKSSRELEELLACYLSLNPDEYHHLIIKAFEQIWFDLPHLHL